MSPLAAQVPADRIRVLDATPPRADGKFVLYWMTSTRRARWNYALDRAVELARELDCPLVVLEALRVDYPWASDRLHRFVLEGMADNARAFEGTGVLYHPYVEPEVGAGSGLLESLAEHACAIVCDEFPCGFHPRMIAAAAARTRVHFEVVDSNGLLPLSVSGKPFSRAFDFRRHLQRELPHHLDLTPRSKPHLSSLRPRLRLPPGITGRWPRAEAQLLQGDVSSLPIDHTVGPVDVKGGPTAGRQRLRQFTKHALDHYGEDRNRLDSDGTSALSPYLHFGHVSPHEILHAIAARYDWTPGRVSGETTGGREGWWGLPGAAEAYLDQLTTWRELCFNTCVHRPDYASFESLPAWALETLDEHAADPRLQVYTVDQFERGETHDELWNAAQNQLRCEGRIHNYLRMLWGKKILHWSDSPREALEIMLALNDKYAVDGRDPNSYGGILWVLGRHDRAWGPERPIFGKVRYMSSDNTRRKMRVGNYVERWGGGAAADSVGCAKHELPFP